MPLTFYSPCEPYLVCITSPWAALVGCPVEGPPLIPFTITIGVSDMAAYPIASCISENPGPDVAVIDFTPPQEAPMIADMHAISSSICRKTPLVPLSRWASPSAISVDGVIGYPAKNRMPEPIAPSTQASLPWRKNSPLAAFISSDPPQSQGAMISPGLGSFEP